MRWNCKRNFFTESSRKNILTVRCTGLWNSIPGGAVEALSLESFGARDNKTLTRRGLPCFTLLYHQHLYFCNIWLWINCKGGSVGRGETNIIFNIKEHRNTMGKWFVCLFWKRSYLQVWLSKSFFTCTCRSVIESCDKTLVSDAQRRKSSDCKIKTRKKDKEGKYVSQDKNSSLLIQTANSND